MSSTKHYVVTWSEHAVKNVKKNFQHACVSFCLMRGSSRSQKSFLSHSQFRKSFSSIRHIKMCTWNIFRLIFFSLPSYSMFTLSRGMNVWALLECLCIIQGNVRGDMFCAHTFLLFLSLKWYTREAKIISLENWDGAWMFYNKKVPDCFWMVENCRKSGKLRNYVTSDDCIY